MHRWNQLGTVEARAEGDARPMIFGHAAVFDQETTLWEGYREVIRPGAFDGAEFSDELRAVFDHEPSKILGRLGVRSGPGSLRLEVDDVGLRYEVEPVDTTVGRDTLELVRSGVVSGSSFMFTVTEDRETRNGDETLREILSIGRVIDVSPVINPAYTGAEAEARARLTTLASEIHSDPAQEGETPSAIHSDPDPTSQHERRARSLRLLRLQDPEIRNGPNHRPPGAALPDSLPPR